MKQGGEIPPVMQAKHGEQQQSKQQGMQARHSPRKQAIIPLANRPASPKKTYYDGWRDALCSTPRESQGRGRSTAAALAVPTHST